VGRLEVAVTGPPTAAGFLADLATFIGTTEKPAGSNCNPFSHALGRPCERWCADFLAARAKALGLELPSYSASTRTMAAAFKFVERWHTTPLAGDFGFCDFPDNTSGVQHVAGIERVDPDGTIWTIEANTSSGVAGSQSNGGGVWRRRRARSIFVGFGRPGYAPAPPRGIPFAFTTGTPRELDPMQRLVPKHDSGPTDDKGRAEYLIPWSIDSVVGPKSHCEANPRRTGGYDPVANTCTMTPDQMPDGSPATEIVIQNDTPNSEFHLWYHVLEEQA
jgi:hypothetical protein